MIKTLIKHTIADCVISVFFNQVYDNLITSVMTPDVIQYVVRNMQVGERSVSSQWSLELARDLKRFHDVDIEELMETAMRDELKLDRSALGTASNHTRLVYSP